MTKPKRGGKYERQDGTTIADDNIDRRYKRPNILTTETVTNPEQRKPQDTTGNHYIVIYKDGTRREVPGTSEAQVRKTYSGTGDKAIVEVEKVKKRKK